MKEYWIFIALLTATTPAPAADSLNADIRHRPPEMILESKSKSSGPLKTIIEEAVSAIGFKIKWRAAPFPRSLHGLKYGSVDIVPRLIRTREREEFVLYLGPIGCQTKDILFLVKKGQESLINRYEDLYLIKVGVKRATAYFQPFDSDSKIDKDQQKDDANMAGMFMRGRFKTMAVLDKTAIESALSAHEFNDYSYANYRYRQVIGNYYGMSRLSAHAKQYEKLNTVIKQMATSGRVAEIYQSYQAAPPSLASCN
ncbi:substrate-binding periplasmic protein [Dongshaea marina]|uniref:substrate-binding periplasmic protein n=1 Tax=Dongshaea marina TaxID=2047966 RepID=UPI000D3E668B|nr:ABC transporter substrate-binding protein [Dongshaea marina]